MVYKNAEIRNAGKLIRTNVEVDCYAPITGPSAGTVEWGGVLRPPNNIGLGVGKTYTLVLPGFAPSKIVITEEANPVDSSVSFKGVGESPARVTSQGVQTAK